MEDAEVRFGADGFVPYAGELLFAFNMKNPKFADSRVREALLRAVDRGSLVRAVYGSTVDPLDSLTVSGVPGFQKDACGSTCNFDRRRAQALLKEARPNQPPLEVALDYDEDPTQQAVARALQSNLEEIGVKVELRPKPLGEYQNFVLTGQQEIFRLGWIAAYPSADAFLFPLFTTESPSNLTGILGAGGRCPAPRRPSDRRRRPTPGAVSSSRAGSDVVCAGHPDCPAEGPHGGVQAGDRLGDERDGLVRRHRHLDSELGPQSGLYDQALRSEWRNWQTRWLEGPVPARAWGFKSPLRHHAMGVGPWRDRLN